MNPTSASSKKSNSLSDKDDNENAVAEMDENELQALLEEAMNYKKPSDIETKSECFKKLLKSTTEEDERMNSVFEQWLPKKRSRNQHGGSLQDLPEASSNEFYGNTYSSIFPYLNHSGAVTNSSFNSGGKKHSRRKHSSTSSSSVSSRQREGGSLPNNVNMPTPIDYFINDCRKSSKKSGKNDSKIEKPQTSSMGAYTVIDMSDIGDIDEKQHLLAHDSLGISSTQHNNEGGIEMKPLSYTNSLNLEIGTSGDCSKKPFRSTTASSSLSTKTTFMTTGTTITSPAITGAKSSTTSSITSSSSTGPMTSFGTMSVDKGIEYNIEKPKSYQQQNHVYITNSTAMSSSNIVSNAGLHNGPSDALPKSQVVITTPIQLQQGYNAVSCLVDRGFPISAKSSTTSQRVDEPTNSLLPSMSTPGFGTSAAPASGTNSHTTSSTKERKEKPKRSKHERNVTTFTADSIQGSRGNEDLDSLLSFIENNSNKDDKKESKPKNGFLNNELLNSENKLKKSQTKNKEKSEKVHQKLKKCSSLEELSSANRNSNKDSSANNKSSAEHNSNNVTLRSKSSNTNSKDKENKKNSSNNNNNSNTNSSNTSEKVNNKRNERRSWGTEELNYLGENSMDLQKKLPTEPVVVKPKETSVKDLDKKNANDSSSSSSSGAFESLSIVSIEQIASNTLETAEFHVVTKKRKTKKKTNEEIHASVKINAHQFPKRDNYQNRGNHKQQQTSQDKSAGTAKGDGKSGKNRRKSTSSVPPSEKSDDSDMDSVHSLPVKSTKTTSSLLSAGTTHHHHNHNQQHQQQQQQQSKTQKHTEDTNAKNHKQKLNMIMSPPIVSPQPVKTTASPSSQISYADMAKKISSNNNSNNILNSSNKLDKTSNSNDQWPSVSSTNRLSSELVGTSSFPFSTSTGSVTPPITTIINQNTQNSVEKKKTTGKLSYPELVECNNTKNKLLNNSVEHEIVNSQDTNNNNEPKKTIISYSQSLLDDNGNIKLINEDKPSTLHKSKSFDQPTTTVVDPFPALEKTLTKQQSQKSLNDPPPKSMIATAVKTVKNPNEGAKKLKSPNGKIGNGLGPTAAVSLKLSSSSPGNLENAMKIHPESIKVDSEMVEKKIKKDKKSTAGHGLTNGTSTQRPAVIILNYPNRKTSDDEDISSITFGFDIDEHLLHSSDDEAATNKPSTQGNNECSSLVNIKTNYCDINDKSLNNSSNCNDLEENFIVNNASNISSNLIKNQSSPKQLLEHEVANDNDGGKSREISDLEVSQSSNDLGYSSLVTNPSPKDPKKIKSQQQLMKNEMELDQAIVDDPINHAIEFELTTEQNSHCQSENTMIGTTKNSMVKKEQTFVPSALPKFIDPEGLQSFTFNHEKIVHFVGEEWDKFVRNGVKYFEEL